MTTDHSVSMSSRRFRHAACLLVLPFLLGQGCPPFHPGPRSCADGDYHHYQQDRRIVLPLDTTRIALYAPAGIGTEATSALQAVGVDPASLQPHGLAGWHYAVVPAEKADACGVEDLVATLAAGNAFDFVTPVFLDDRGNPILMTRDTLVRFQAGLSQDQAQQILDQLQAGQITSIPWPDSLPDIYSVRSTSRDGFAALAAENRLNEHSAVIFAEVDIIFTSQGAD